MREIYRAADLPTRRQVWLLLFGLGVFIVANALIAAQGGEPGAVRVEPVGWVALVTPQNIAMVGMLVYGAGTLREQFAQVRERLDQVERDYVRRDVYAAELSALSRRVEDVSRQRAD